MNSVENADVSYIKHFGNDDALVDVIFFHGLTGSAYETWASKADKTFWPEWLLQDLGYLAIHSVTYPASLFNKWASKEMDMFERAGNVLENLVGRGFGSRPIVFVTHSLGGILAKMLLRRSNESEDVDCRLISESTQLVIFLSTPHTGASLAKTLDVLPNTSPHIKLLKNDTGFLEDLNQQYRKFANSKSDLRTVSYYEKHATKKVSVIVTRESADPGVSGCEPCAMDRDHINICKPHDKDDLVYFGIKRRIDTIVRKQQQQSLDNDSSPTTDDYSTKFENDRRDLLQKLIDAGREHEYDYANNAQNKFARQFTKTGLFTKARENHDILLSEVESRFINHVYHPLICKGAKDESIREALQLHVIDILANRKIGETSFSSTVVLNALYYLTEQCHIKWDFQE